jgi:hypothetical protein
LGFTSSTTLTDSAAAVDRIIHAGFGNLAGARQEGDLIAKRRSVPHHLRDRSACSGPGDRTTHPFLEALQSLAIVCSNLNEFYMGACGDDA